MIKRLHSIVERFTNLKLILAFLGVFITQFSYSQGSLMLVGGGSETDGGWSDTPYQWMVDQAENKRVAVISFSEPTDWLVNYFESLGAVHADTFWINTVAYADLQSTYDSLITYDAVFMRGGDQEDYYETYLNTKTQEALQHIYSNGGVLGGTSAGMALLGDVAFTAQQGSVYPDECIQNPRLSFITLKDDFLMTLDNWIFDTHFIERGRLGRLAAFMENWYIETGETISGIGVDDKTALCIYKDSAAYVYGTAAANIIQAGAEGEPFDTVNSSMMKTRNLKLTQLIHNCVINLETGEIDGLSNAINTDNEEETSMYTLLMSGSNEIAHNHSMFDYLLNNLGITENILVVTGSSTSMAESTKTYLENNGALSVDVYQALSAHQNDPDFANAIEAAQTVLIIDNATAQFNNFINGGSNGNALNAKIRQDNMVTVLVGGNSMFASGAVVENLFTDESASYYGTFSVGDGLGLLQTTAVVPRTYELSTDFYENTISAIPWLMVQEGYKFGLWIPRESFVKYYFDQDLKPHIKYIDGNYPAMMLINKGCNTGNAGYWSPPRNVAGFEEMDYYFLTNDDSVQVGEMVVSTIANLNPNYLSFSMEPNPASDFIKVSCEGYVGEIYLYDMQGKLVLEETMSEEKMIDVSDISGGSYLLKTNNDSMVKKIIIR